VVHLKVGPLPLAANRCNAHGSEAGLRTRISARVGGDAAKSFLPVVVLTHAGHAQAIAAHGVVNTADQDVTTTKSSGGGAIWVGCTAHLVRHTTAVCITCPVAVAASN
jgi:hypothetical protein